MNKLLLLTLLGFVLIAIAGAEEENQEQNKEVENIQNRDIIEAGKKSTRKSRSRKAKAKKKKPGRKTKKGRNTRKSKKTKKSSKKGRRKGQKKKGQKSKKSKKVKSIKNKSKSSRKKLKSKRKGKKSTVTSRNSTCLSFTCIDDATRYLKLLKRGANHEKQLARVQRQNKTRGGKAGKKGLFEPVVRRIVENGGGNASDLKCNGASNAGSAQLTNLTETLLKCEDDIHSLCSHTNLPQTNMTEVKICNEAIATFKTTTTKCIKMSGSAACACWTDETLARDAAIVKKCDLSDHAKEFAKSLKNCTHAFIKCRKYEDDVGKAIHACNIDTSTLTKKLKNLQANSAALSSLQTKLNATASTRNIHDINDRQSIACSAVISTTKTIITLVSQNPVSYSILTMIQNVISVTFTCTETEKTAIKSVSASVSQAIVMVEADITHVKEVFASVTGKEVSDAEIESASLCKTDDECDALIEFPEESATTAAAEPASAAPSSAAPSSAAPSSEAPSSAAPSSAAPASMAPSSGAPSSKSPVATTPVPSSPSAAASPEATSPPIMTTGSSTRKARRYMQQLMRKRMVQTLV